MTQLIWLTDTHLDFAPGMAKIFGDYLARDYPDSKGIILTGDISNGERLKKDLEELVEGYKKPIYFCLGNHDSYRKSFAYVNQVMKELKNPNLIYLDNNGPVLLDEKTTLIGNSNWYDCRYGNVETSSIELNDYYLIDEFRRFKNFKEMKVDAAQKRAAEQAEKLKVQLSLVTTERVIIAVHVPIFNRATWHEGRLSDSEWLPWMSSKITGETILDFKDQHPDTKIVTLQGHTHSSGIFELDDKLVCYTGKAEYGRPRECGLIDVGSENISVVLK